MRCFRINTAVVLRREQAELYRPTIEPQDYEMVELFIKRLKLWMGITKAKEVSGTMAVVPFSENNRNLSYIQYKPQSPNILLPL